MININLGNIIGATTSIQGESTSTESLSTWSDFIGEFELSLENNGDISNKIEGVDEGLILYNFIYTLYQNLTKPKIFRLLIHILVIYLTIRIVL